MNDLSKSEKSLPDLSGVGELIGKAVGACPHCHLCAVTILMAITANEDGKAYSSHPHVETFKKVLDLLDSKGLDTMVPKLWYFASVVELLVDELNAADNVNHEEDTVH